MHPSEEMDATQRPFETAMPKQEAVRRLDCLRRRADRRTSEGRARRPVDLLRPSRTRRSRDTRQSEARRSHGGCRSPPPRAPGTRSGGGTRRCAARSARRPFAPEPRNHEAHHPAKSSRFSLARSTNGLEHALSLSPDGTRKQSHEPDSNAEPWKAQSEHKGADCEKYD